VNQAIPCPYCGHIGYHMWAGGGGCPGAVSERERDAVAAVYLRAYAERIKLKDAEIERIKVLLRRAADALDNPRAGSESLDDDYDLIILLRKAV
jgi:hypothetical protein